MKKKLISAFAISALLMSGLTALSACSQKPAESSKQTSGDTSSQNVGEKYSVKYTASSDYTINGLKESYDAGETVTFTVTVNNSEKRLSAVRVGGEKITPDANGQYSFVINEDTSIRITLMDAPVLTAFYSGNPVVGETLVFTTRVDFDENNAFTITAKTGADLVEINGHNVKLLAVGTAVLDITATVGSDTLKTSVTINIFENEAGLGTNIAYSTNLTKSGAESLAGNNPGTWIYWAGDGGAMESFTYDAAKNEYEAKYVNSTWAFYGVQFFYSLPYAQQGDNYKVRWEVESDVAGTITVNATRVNLQPGSNLIGLDITQGSGSTISVQLGYTDGANQVPLAGGTTLKFKPVRIYDADATHKYNHVTFALDGVILKDIFVRDGEKVSAPEVEEQTGKVFTGFFDGEAKYDENVVPTKDTNYVARYVTKTEENTAVATLMLGTSELAKVDVYKGNKLIVPNGLNYGFGQQLKGLYKDSALTQAFDMNSGINEDITLYVKTQIVYESTYVNDGALGYKIPNEWTTYNDDGSITLKFDGWGSSDKWHIQANFTDSMIKGSLGERYTITFVYSINQEGADAQVYDGNTLDMAVLTVGEKQEASVTYEGGAHEGDFKLTFELGGIDLDAKVEFTLHSIGIAKA